MKCEKKNIDGLVVSQSIVFLRCARLLCVRLHSAPTHSKVFKTFDFYSEGITQPGYEFVSFICNSYRATYCTFKVLTVFY